MRERYPDVNTEDVPDQALAKFNVKTGGVYNDMDLTDDWSFWTWHVADVMVQE